MVNPGPWHKCRTQHFKSHPKDPKIFMGHGISPIYMDICFTFISEKICKSSGQHFRERDKHINFKLHSNFCFRRKYKVGRGSNVWSRDYSLVRLSRESELSRSVSLVWHSVTKCAQATPSLTTLADLLGNRSKVYTCIDGCYRMLHEYFRVFGMWFEVLSPTFVSWTRIYHAGYPLAINSGYRIP